MNSANTLAVLGGKPVRTKPFEGRPHIDDNEKKLVMEALENDEFSRYSGPYLMNIDEHLHVKSVDALGYNSYWHFLGGRNARTFEADFSRYFGIDYSIAVNSATTGLSIALAACGVGPGDEVITTPLTFTASTSSILLFNSIPVFVDVDPETFCIDPRKIEEAVTDHTKAILLVHLYGNACDMDSIMAIAKKHHLRVIEDCAQAPGVKYKGRYVGTIGDCGVFSFQQTKNIMTGEGGMITTNDPAVARKCRLIRNHGEGAITEDQDLDAITNIVGLNVRMTELSAAIGRAQLPKLKMLNTLRNENAKIFIDGVRDISQLAVPEIEEGTEQYWHLVALRYLEKDSGVPRSVVMQALRAEGIPLFPGYIRLNYENPTFLRKIAYGKDGCPFTCSSYKGHVTYFRGMCPVAEDLVKNRHICFFQIGYPTTREDMHDVVTAFKKVFSQMDVLTRNKEKIMEEYNKSLGALIR